MLIFGRILALDGERPKIKLKSGWNLALTVERPVFMPNYARNLALDGETADNHAKIRPESRIGRRNGWQLYENPAGISHWTEKRLTISLIFFRNLA